MDTITSTPALAPPELLPRAVAVERISVPLGGGLVVSTSAANCTADVWPAPSTKAQWTVPPVGHAKLLGTPRQLPPCPMLPTGTVLWLGTCASIT